jgi:hypothetical protein
MYMRYLHKTIVHLESKDPGYLAGVFCFVARQHSESAEPKHEAGKDGFSRWGVAFLPGSDFFRKLEKLFSPLEVFQPWPSN